MSRARRMHRGCVEFPDKFEKFIFSKFFKVFHHFWYPGRSSGGSGDSLGIENIRKTCFEVLQSSQNAQEMCRNDFRTSLKKIIFYFSWFSKIFNILGPKMSDPGQIWGFSRFWTKKCVGYAICIEDTTQLGVGHTILDHTGSISYVLEMFSEIFGKSNLCTNF